MSSVLEKKNEKEIILSSRQTYLPRLRRRTGLTCWILSQNQKRMLEW